MKTYGIDLNAHQYQLTTFVKLTQVYTNCVWVNEATDLIIERKLGVYTVYFNDNFDCVLAVCNNITDAKREVIKHYHAIKSMLYSN
jgi:hypothetical protein